MAVDVCRPDRLVIILRAVEIILLAQRISELAGVSSVRVASRELGRGVLILWLSVLN